MKSFKRLGCMVLMLFCACGMASPLESLAYDSCDVDHDGDVDITDAMKASLYLSGTYQPTFGWSRFDTNGNLIVDETDIKKILATLVDLDYDCVFVDIINESSTNVIDSETAQNFEVEESVDDIGDVVSLSNSISSTRYYYKFDYENQQLSSQLYGLNRIVGDSSSMSSISSVVSTDSLFDQSDFYRVNGNGSDGIVRIVASFPNDSQALVTTGFIVGDHVIATCAHGLFKDQNSDKEMTANELPYSLVIGTFDEDGYPAMNGNTQVTLTPKEIHIPRPFVDPRVEGLVVTNFYPFDYALISVEEDLSSYSHFYLGTPSAANTSSFRQVDLFASGSASNLVYTCDGNATTNNTIATPDLLWYNCPTVGGFSGCPIYVAYDCTYGNSVTRLNCAMAVHSSNGLGVTIDDRVRKFYLSNATNIGY